MDRISWFKTVWLCNGKKVDVLGIRPFSYFLNKVGLKTQKSINIFRQKSVFHNYVLDFKYTLLNILGLFTFFLTAWQSVMDKCCRPNSCRKYESYKLDFCMSTQVLCQVHSIIRFLFFGQSEQKTKKSDVIFRQNADFLYKK